jgi:hypothetical protein
MKTAAISPMPIGIGENPQKTIWAPIRPWRHRHIRVLLHHSHHGMNPTVRCSIRIADKNGSSKGYFEKSMSR